MAVRSTRTVRPVIWHAIVASFLFFFSPFSQLFFFLYLLKKKMGASRLVIACSTICRCVGSSFSARLFDSLAICSYAPCFPKTLGYLSCARSHWETEWWNEMLMCSALFFLLTPLFSVSLHFSLRIYLFIYLSILFFVFFLPFSWSCRVGLHRKARVPMWWVHLAVARLIWFDFFCFSFVNIHM